ncbi:MAG TPA: transcriptional regulator [Terracidiphilus sp.]|nr:transcriptional regulator [Terracidiphilus sp.]
MAPVFLAVAGILFFALGLQAQKPWTVAGPSGGDARSFASVPGQPDHLYLGTTNSWLYESLDGGRSWRRLAKLDPVDGYVIDSIVVDATNPSTLYVGAWKDSNGGGLWISHDGGHSWTQNAAFKGQPIHALVQAPSDPRTLFAGTLGGVFRSSDAGATWRQISPAGDREIHEIESLAVDPKNDRIVYAGTWHLPWKTVDGGRTWHNIKQGLIVDSDVFSIIVDPERPRTVYLSACSGIYKSENAGLLFHKIQGIPSAARRTRVLMQNPKNFNVVYAGTTEGLYKTEDAGHRFRLMTPSDIVVNDVYVDPSDPRHVLLATDRGGVLASQDAGETFTQSNDGISERKVSALLVDRANPSLLYAGVVNDKNFGGVFRSTDGGTSWEQLAQGLDGRDVFSLSQTKDGTVVAGTSHGIFILDPPAGDSPAAAGAAPSAAVLTWEPKNAIANTVMKSMTEKAYRGKRVTIERQEKAPVVELDSRVGALDVSGDVWAATTDLGVLTSHDQGATWQGGPIMGAGDYLSVAVHGKIIVAARADGVVISRDEGQTWWPMGQPQMLTRIHRVIFSPDGTLWLGAREGVYFTRDLGKTWLWFERLPFRDVDDLSYDAASKRILVSSRSSDQIFSIDPKTMTWLWWRAGYPVALIRVAGERLVAASLDDGILIGPQSAAGAGHTGK